jgi:hypothetical protein
VTAASTAASEARAYEKHRRNHHPMSQRLWDLYDRSGRRHLAARARRIFGRRFDDSKFLIDKEPIRNTQVLTHVQITIEGFQGALVLYATHSPLMWLARFLSIGVYCPVCRYRGQSRWVSPWGRWFLRGIGSFRGIGWFTDNSHFPCPGPPTNG